MNVNIRSYNRIIGNGKLMIHQEVFTLINDLGVDKTEEYLNHLVDNSHFKTKTDKNKAMYRVSCINQLKMCGLR